MKPITHSVTRSALWLGCGLLATACAVDMESSIDPELEQAEPGFAQTQYDQHRMPWPAGQVARVARRNGSGHTNQIDFVLDQGDPQGDAVYATKAGRVVFAKDSSNTNCTQPPSVSSTCWQNANMVVIEHGPGEYTWYVHLAHDSVPFEAGAWVDAGTRVGTEGATGYTSPANAVHLHFMKSNAVPAFPNPSIPNVAPWPASYSIVPIDFAEYGWTELNYGGGNYQSHNSTDPAAVSWGSGHTTVFAQGTDNRLWHRDYVNGWGAWQSLDGILTAPPDAASWGTGHMDAYVRGTDNNIYLRRYQNGAWQGWQGIDAPPGGASSAPAAASSGFGRMDVFVRGADDALWHRSYASGSWAAWKRVGGVLTSAPDAAARADGSIDVFVRNLESGAATRRLVAGQWQDWETLGGILTAHPGAASSGSGVTMFARGLDDALWYRDGGSGWGDWQPLDGILASGPDASSQGAGHMQVFVRGIDRNVYGRTRQNGSWSGWYSVEKP